MAFSHNLSYTMCKKNYSTFFSFFVLYGILLYVLKLDKYFQNHVIGSILKLKGQVKTINKKHQRTEHSFRSETHAAVSCLVSEQVLRTWF